MYNTRGDVDCHYITFIQHKAKLSVPLFEVSSFGLEAFALSLLEQPLRPLKATIAVDDTP